MKKLFRSREHLTAALFLAALLIGVCLWLWGYFAPANTSGMAPPVRATSLTDAFTNAETIINDSLDRSHHFIQLYGGIQRLLGRRMLTDAANQNTVYKLSDGSLTFINPNPSADLSANADAFLALQNALNEKNIPLLYLQAPQKIGREGTPTLPAGVADYGNENADRFLSLITTNGASVLDFRDILEQDGQPWTSYFFTTDHHWKPETALLCTQALVDDLNETYELGLDPTLTASDPFSAQVYEDIFLGSQGKRTGSLYAGMDDLTVLTPNYSTDFTYSIPSTETTRTGTFEESLLFMERLEEPDPFQSNPYTLYAGGDYDLAQMINHQNPDGPKIVLLRDSYSCALAPFLALQCSELTTIDLRYFEGDLLSCIEQLDPDLVLTLYTPGAVANSSFFHFFAEPTA